MPPPRPVDPSAAPPHDRGDVDALISQTRRLRGGLDAVRRDADAGLDLSDDPRARWRRALCDLAAHQLDDLGGHLGQLREGLPVGPPEPDHAPSPPPGSGGRLQPPPGRAGSAEWDLLTDEVTWSAELYEIFGRDPREGGLTLDELPAWVFCADQPLLTALVTDCLVDGRPIDGEFRVVRADGAVRTVHMTGEPELDGGGCVTSLWAVLRDVSELRRGQRTVRETGARLRDHRRGARAEHRLAVRLQETVLPPWRTAPRPARSGPAALDVAAHYFPAASSALIGGDWFDALPLPGGGTLLSVGDLTGHGVPAASGTAMLLGALRGMALAGVAPGALMGCLNQLVDAAEEPTLGSALVARYDPAGRALVWAQAGHPPPLLFRDGTGRALRAPDGVLLGVLAGAAYAQASEPLAPGDLLVLHTDGLSARGAAPGPYDGPYGPAGPRGPGRSYGAAAAGA
ncbi:SpoIIE family protein phosphatase, partial [Streptomyces sp. B1866]|uniref:PP2C family protein-serine/threonine phosphatase n=1 Tax=Streptomyces sp. B1866 TaxID=3075431 RepID=UPI00288E4873